MGMNKFVMNLEAIWTSFFTISGTISTIERFFVASQVPIVMHGFLFHPIVLKIHAIAENIIYGYIIRTGRKTLVTTHSTVLIIRLTLILGNHFQISPV